jgi:hypothetical protein
MSDEPDQLELDLSLGAEYDRAPPWARALARSVMRTHGDVARMKQVLGAEPDADGRGGSGLIGDVRKLGRELGQLASLKTMGVGFVAALSIFGALILLGVAHWVQSIATGGR